MKPVCCKVKTAANGNYTVKGLFLGLLINQTSGDLEAVVWHPDHGMMLQMYHLSRVELTPGEP